MGMILGKITVETPKHEVIQSTNEYEIRKYPASIIAEVTYDPTQMNGNKDGGFTILANYIGALGNPQNTKAESVAMTAPVVTQSKTTEAKAEVIAMTAPVVTREQSQGDGEKKMITMQFILPEKYKRVEDAPKPLDERVAVKEEGERKYGVVKFSGGASDGVVKDKAEGLRVALEKDGYNVIGEYLLARYNPPWTLPFLKTNEVFIPIE